VRRTERVYLRCTRTALFILRAIGAVRFPRREVKHLLPATVLKLRSIRPQEWTATIHEHLINAVQSMTSNEAKVKFLSKCPCRVSNGFEHASFRSDPNVAAVRHNVLHRSGNQSHRKESRLIDAVAIRSLPVRRRSHHSITLLSRCVQRRHPLPRHRNSSEIRAYPLAVTLEPEMLGYDLYDLVQ
jgi:hypothetical protein